MASKKGSSGKKTQEISVDGVDRNLDRSSLDQIGTAADLKKFFESVLDKIKESTAPAIYVASAMNYILNIPTVYSLLNNENRELARDIWLRLKQSGLQLRNPPMLFAEGE